MANGKRVKDFRPASRNANKHTARGMGELQKSIQTDGWIGAMTTAADGEMIAGSARIETVAQVFGTDAEPIIVETDGTRPVLVVRTDIPNAEDKRAQRLALADNRVHEIDMSWDVEVLAGFDADVLGDLWTPEELSDLGQQWADEQRSKQEDAGAQIDKAEELRVKWGVESGQLWHLGEHRLICGDCTDRATVARVMGGEKARLCHTDPPYGVDYANVLGGRENQKAGGWSDIQNDALSDEELEEFLVKAFSLTEAPVLFCWHSWRRIERFLSAIKRCGWKPNAEIVWVKNALVFGRSDYQWRHECCIYAKRQDAGRQDDRKQTTVWEFDKTTGAMHPTQKPVGLFEIPLLNHTDPGDICYEPFSGSGSQIIACERLGRKCRAVEISPGYCAVAIERWAQTTGGTPILANGA